MRQTESSGAHFLRFSGYGTGVSIGSPPSGCYRHSGTRRRGVATFGEVPVLHRDTTTVIQPFSPLQPIRICCLLGCSAVRAISVCSAARCSIATEGIGVTKGWDYCLGVLVLRYVRAVTKVAGSVGGEETRKRRKGVQQQIGYLRERCSETTILVRAYGEVGCRVR